MTKDNLPIVSSPSQGVGPVETTSTTIAAQVRAAVEARYTLALHRPRNWDEVRVRILTACKRPSFAGNKSVLYRKPIGAGVEGLGIRFVEEALRCMGNVMPEVTTVYDDPSRRIVRVALTDLEANLTYSQDLTIMKTVERSRPDGNGAYLSSRTNTQGRVVYTVLATDDEFANKESAMVSKAIRAQGLRLIPGDIKDEAEEIIRSIRTDRAAKDPAGERKAIADAFSMLNVTPSMIEDYLGHPLALCMPAEIVELRGLYGAIRDGETTWTSVVEGKKGEKEMNNPASSVPEDLSADIINLMARIDAATSIEALEALRPDVAGWVGPGRERLKRAWKSRKSELLAAATTAAVAEDDPADVLVGDDYVSAPSADAPN